MKEVKSHEISKSQERRTRSVKNISRDDLIDILVAISIITKRIAKRLNNVEQKGTENE